eukprot:372475_1
MNVYSNIKLVQFLLHVLFLLNEGIISNVTCGDVIINTFKGNEIKPIVHKYKLITDHSYNVNFDDCESNIDVTLILLDDSQYIISDSYCMDGDNCGLCDGIATSRAENFTIQWLYSGAYIIEISSIQTGNYSLHITCTNPLQTEHTCQVYDTTKHAFPSNVSYSVPVYNSLEIHFQLKLSNYHNNDTISILSVNSINPKYIPNEYSEFLYLSINHMSKQFQVHTRNCDGDGNLCKIQYENNIYPMDGQFHNIVLSYTFGVQSYNNVFKFDHHIYYFKSDDYALPISEYTINFDTEYAASTRGLIKEICIQSPVNSIDLYPIQSTISCNDYISGNHSRYVYLELNDTYFVIFDFCTPQYLETTMELYFDNFTQIVLLESFDCDWSGIEILQQHLVAGRYIMYIRGFDTYGMWSLNIRCSKSQFVGNKYTFKSLSGAERCDTWHTAEGNCESVGSTLATVNTNDDLFIVTEQLQHISSITNDTQTLIFRVGLFRDPYPKSQWRWIDGTMTIHDSYYSDMLNDNISETNWQLGTILGVEISSNGDWKLTNLIAISSCVSFDVLLCNAPNSTYVTKNCTRDCWTPGQIIESKDIFLDIVPAYSCSETIDYVKFKTAYWNHTLFVLGQNSIYYTKLQLFDKYASNLNTVHLSYSENTLCSTASLYTQYLSYMFIYGWHKGQEYLISLNLETLQPDVIYSEWFDQQTAKCLSASANILFLGKYDSLLIYNRTYEEWTVLGTPSYSEFHTLNNILFCSIDNTERYVYLFNVYTDWTAFGHDYNYQDVYVVSKLDVNTKLFEHFPITDICQGTTLKTVVMRDSKIYIHGCYISGWKTMIFNTENDQFEMRYVSIREPNSFDMPHYKASQLTIIEDNVLLLIHQSHMTYSFMWHYFITNNVSINYLDTNTMDIWPSDGMILNYNFNDFTNNSGLTHYINLTSLHNSVPITIPITLSASADGCICDVYKCYNCSQHINLQDHLIFDTSESDIITFEPIYANSETNALFVPNNIILTFQRCRIQVNTKNMITSDDAKIQFNFTLSPSCLERIEQLYSMNINIPYFSQIMQLNVSIFNNQSILCKLCNLWSVQKMICSDCSDRKAFIIHQTNSSVDDTVLDIYLTSNNINFAVSPNHKTITYYKRKTKNLNNRLLYWLVLLTIVPCIITLLLYKFRKEYMNAFIVENALVLVIGISQFDDKNKFLSAVGENVSQLIKLWRDEYKYNVFVCNERSLYSTKYDVINFVDETLKQLDDSHKCVIVHIISHSKIGSFTTSDLKSVEIDFIKHELADCRQNKPLIKIIFHHGCQGTDNYSINSVYSKQTKTRTSLFSYLKNTNDIKNDNIASTDANSCIICGNVDGRTMSDSGYFTDSICHSFRNNINKMIKSDLSALILQIGQDLENKTNHSEICTIKESNLRYGTIRFEKQTSMKNMKQRKHKKQNMLTESLLSHDTLNAIQMQPLIVSHSHN